MVRDLGLIIGELVWYHEYMGLLIQLLVSSIAIYITARILPGVMLPDLYTAIVVAIVLGLVNTFIRPVLTFFTLPLTILSLGFFSLIINAAMILLVDYFVSSFSVEGWITALLFSLVLSVVNFVLYRFIS